MLRLLLFFFGGGCPSREKTGGGESLDALRGLVPFAKKPVFWKQKVRLESPSDPLKMVGHYPK